MKTLEQKIQQMIAGEKKRRSIAIGWLDTVTKILLPVMADLFGDAETLKNTYQFNDNTITLKIGEKETNIYFRYTKHEGRNDTEAVGFYTIGNNDMNVWGDSVENQRGNDFWRVIRTVVEWLPEFQKIIEKKENSRNDLLSKLLIE